MRGAPTMRGEARRAGVALVHQSPQRLHVFHRLGRVHPDQRQRPVGILRQGRFVPLDPGIRVANLVDFVGRELHESWIPLPDRLVVVRHAVAELN